LNSSDTPTNIQGWLRDHSELLALSFRSSGRIQHAVTKGESREHQILDTLSKLLPTRASVESNVVIIDATDVQSPKFDGALVDRTLWPRLFADGNTTGVMIESVLAAIEVKSSLDKTELDDVFSKSAKLRAMRSGRNRALVTGFAYECVFYFPRDFLEAVDANEDNLTIARKHFGRKANEEIETLYDAARIAIGLS